MSSRSRASAAETLRVAPVVIDAPTSSALQVTIDLGLLAEALAAQLAPRLSRATHETAPPKRAYRVPEVATNLSMSEREVWELLSSGELESIRVGRTRLVPASALDAWIARKLGVERHT